MSTIAGFTAKYPMEICATSVTSNIVFLINSIGTPVRKNHVE